MIVKPLLVCGALICALAPAAAAAQDGADSYPQKVVKVVVPGGPGGPADILARIIAERLQTALRQSVIIENIPGGGGIVASRSIARATPDGHTLLFGNTTTFSIIPAISRNPGYDPQQHFAPVAKVADAFQVLVVEPGNTAKSVRDLIAHAKANPGRLNYGAIYGALPHLAGELLKSSAGLDIVHVSYKTEPETLTGVLGRQIQLSFPNVATTLPLVREGTLRALAVTSAVRRAELPDVPTMIESGVADYVATSFFGVAAPAGTPTAIVAKLNGAINQVLTSNEVQASLARLGAAPSAGTPLEFATFIAAERQKWTAVAASAGIKID
jgi:tripartite-type tricarboxylate transporter receptor subunit TctC